MLKCLQCIRQAEKRRSLYTPEHVGWHEIAIEGVELHRAGHQSIVFHRRVDDLLHDGVQILGCECVCQMNVCLDLQFFQLLLLFVLDCVFGSFLLHNSFGENFASVLVSQAIENQNKLASIDVTIIVKERHQSIKLLRSELQFHADSHDLAEKVFRQFLVVEGLKNEGYL